MTHFLDRFRVQLFWLYAALSAILLLFPIRKGDLAGYDDALYAHIAKEVVRSGDWLNIRSNGLPALEHPPLLVWCEAALYSVFGFSDFLAKLPSALAGLGTIFLVPWLTRRLLGDCSIAFLAMFVIATSIYFVKYAARAMTDVPCTFLFMCAVCAWTMRGKHPAWYVVTGMATGLALLSRGLIGLALPLIFAGDLLWQREQPPWRWVVMGLAAAFAPITAWYVHTISANREIFFGVHSTWLRNEVYGSLTPAWRRYTGAPEYLWMLGKSYWPWLPAMLAGIVIVVRARDRRLSLLLIWPVSVFLLCALARSRVLRYMLPAYPAFAILAAAGLSKLPRRFLDLGFLVLTPILISAVVAIALYPPVILHAADSKPLAQHASAVTPSGERIVFFDKGDPRFDELNQFQWYGDRFYLMFQRRMELAKEIANGKNRTLICDKSTYNGLIRTIPPFHLVEERGDLVCIRLELPYVLTNGY